MDIPALIHLDRHERVVHAGGFAASLGPGVSTGYLVVPPRLVEAALSVRRLIDGHWGWVEETALAEFLDSGAYALHLHRLRKTYRDRRDALTEAMRRSFGGSVALSGADAGLHLAWTLPDDTGPAPFVATEARRCGLDAAPVVWSGACSGPPTVVLGFGMPEERKMGPAVRQLATRLAGQPACERLSAD
jgi:GntR family transcriptional regulator/MocR family aminotransferase